MKNISIRTKLLWIILLSNIFTIIVVTVFTLLHKIKDFKTGMENQAHINTTLIASYCSPLVAFNDTIGALEVLKKSDLMEGFVSAVILDNNMKQYTIYGNESLLTIGSGKSDFISHWDDKFYHVFSSISHKDRILGTLYIRFSTETLDSKIREYLWVSFLILISAILLSIVISFTLARSITGPLMLLSQISKKISEDNDYSLRIQKQGNDEIGVLYDSFNLMMQQIQLHEEQINKTLLELKNSEERFSRISTSANEAILLVDEKSNIKYWNPASELMFGYTYQEIIGNSLLKIMYAQGNLKILHSGMKLFYETMTGMSDFKTELCGLKQNGNTFDIELSISETGIDGIPNYVLIIKDISTRKQYEQNLKKAKEAAEESDRLKSAFLANLSHEIRTPMNSIQGFAGLLKKENFNEEKRNQYLTVIRNNTDKLLHLFENILDISLLQSGNLKLYESDFSVQALIDKCSKKLESEAVVHQKHLVEMRIVNQITTKNLWLQGDLLRWEQVIFNVLDNAVKYTEHGFVELVFKQEENNFIIFVNDTGIGIDKEYLPSVFRPFKQVEEGIKRKFGGLGLGMAISSMLMDLMKGSIELVSEINNGTKVKIVFPLVKKASKIITPETITLEDASFEGKIVLIVEDEFSNYELLSESLSDTGVKILWAKNGQEAVNICKKNTNINLVLMDIQMPIMNGYEATKQIKAIQPNLPIVVQTAFALIDEEIKARDAGCDDYLPKPMHIENFNRIVQKYLLD